MTGLGPTELVRQLSGWRLQHRTGVLLLPREELGREHLLAARLGIEAVDLRVWALERLPPDQRILDLTWSKLSWEYLQAIAEAPLPGRCILVSNVDLLVAALRIEQRREYWRYLRGTLRPERGLLLAVPAGADHILTPDERQQWEVLGRLAIWNGDAS